MNPLMKTFVNYKLTTMDAKELLAFAKKYEITMTPSQASRVVAIIQKDHFNLFDEQKRKSVLRAISEQISPELSKSMGQLFHRFIRSQSDN